MKTSDNNAYECYCISLGEVLHKYVVEAQEKKRRSVGTNEEDFSIGYLCAFHRIITLMQQQAEIFEIPHGDLGIDFDENDLI